MNRSRIAFVFVLTLVHGLRAAVAQEDPASNERYFSYFDRNRDGKLSSDELSRMPSRVRGVLKSARVNTSDGVSKATFLKTAGRTLLQMERDREDERRRDEERRREREYEERMRHQQKEADRLIKVYTDLDKNGNKIIEPDELAKSRYRSDIARKMRDAGFDPEKPVSLNAYMTKRLQRAGLDSKFASSLASKGFTPPRQRFKGSAKDRVTIDLPTKYETADRNFDGQISLAEWRVWKGRAALNQFALIDRNGDGFLTPRELSLPIPGPSPTSKQ